jgi:hypothetical protein
MPAKNVISSRLKWTRLSARKKNGGSAAGIEVESLLLRYLCLPPVPADGFGRRLGGEPALRLTGPTDFVTVTRGRVSYLWPCRCPLPPSASCAGWWGFFLGLSQPALCTNRLLRPRIWPSFRASSGLPSAGSGQAHVATYRQVRLRSEPLWLPGGTTISTISRRRLVHNAG